jgi:hypothetical protein
MAADCLQTVDIAKAGRETNVFLGPSPARWHIYLWFGAWTGIHAMLVYLLAPVWREVVQAVPIAVEVVVVGRNWRIGWHVPSGRGPS